MLSKKKELVLQSRSLFVLRFHWRMLDALPSRMGNEPGIHLEASHTNKMTRNQG
jgi:hypothetical protein